MAPAEVQNDLSARRAKFSGPSGIKGIIHNGKTTAIATFAALGGFVYGCEQIQLSVRTRREPTADTRKHR